MAVSKQKKWRIIFLRAYRFVIYDMWRITGNEVSVSRHRLINLVKTIYLSVQRFLADDLQSKAAALTFSTLLAVVPALALVFAVAKGFGFQAIVQSQLFDYFPAHDYRKPYGRHTTLRRLAQDGKAIALLSQYAPAIAGIAMSGEPELGSNSLEEISHKEFLPFDPEQLAKGITELERFIAGEDASKEE